jgi:hypothetical protein
MSTQSTTYVEGNEINFEVQFVNEITNAPINPTNVVFSYRVNGGTPTQVEYISGGSITNSTTGTYNIYVPTAGLAGTWVWQWQGYGVGTSLVSGSLTVTRAPMPLLS